MLQLSSLEDTIQLTVQPDISIGVTNSELAVA
jgi:hypothetical protein